MTTLTAPILAIAGLGVTELVLVLLIALLVFGANKLPQLGDALGRGIRNFKNATNNKKDEPVDLPPKALEDARVRAVDVEHADKHKA
jgi:sec-independent protein translocase protein TatA